MDDVRSESRCGFAGVSGDQEAWLRAWAVRLEWLARRDQPCRFSLAHSEDYMCAASTFLIYLFSVDDGRQCGTADRGVHRVLHDECVALNEKHGNRKLKWCICQRRICNTLLFFFPSFLLPFLPSFPSFALSFSFHLPFLPHLSSIPLLSFPHPSIPVSPFFPSLSLS